MFVQSRAAFGLEKCTSHLSRPRCAPASCLRALHPRAEAGL